MPIIFSTTTPASPACQPPARIYFEAPDDALLARVTEKVAELVGRHLSYTFHDEAPGGVTPIILEDVGPSAQPVETAVVNYPHAAGVVLGSLLLKEHPSGRILTDSVPAVEREQERIAFKDAHRHLELDEVPDAWGRPKFKHSHVEASWLGWKAHASHWQAPAEQEEAAQRLRKTLDIDPGDVNDPLHPRYIAGFKSGHAAGRRRAAPAASPTPPAEQQAQPGAVYAELPAPTASIGTDDAWHEAAMRDFADSTHAARLRCKSEQARLATLWGYVRAEQGGK